jgi:hypothetical protein
MSAELDTVLEMIGSMGRSSTRLALYEQAVRIADAENNTEYGIDLRWELIDEATFTGHPDRAMAAFAWNLAQYDRDPDQIGEFTLLWRYKYVLNAFASFPQISAKQIIDTYDDFARRFEKIGASLRTVHSTRCHLAVVMGDLEEIRKQLTLWKKHPRDYLSDCDACDRNSMVDTHILLGQHKRALQQAEPILNGSMSCGEVPHETYAIVLLPLLLLDRDDEARQYHEAGYALVRGKEEYVGANAYHLVYLVMVDDMTKALKLFTTHLGYALAASVPMRRLEFCQSSLFLFRRMLAVNKTKRKLRLPKAFPLYDDSGIYDIAELCVWFETEATGLAKQFDARNGNSFRMDKLAELKKLERLIRTA